jgi:ABC-type lipoprotein export system ATPase subunit
MNNAGGGNRKKLTSSSGSDGSGSSSIPFMLSCTCSFKHKGITAIIGPVGSGKTTLLLSLLGETKVPESLFCYKQPAVIKYRAYSS